MRGVTFIESIQLPFFGIELFPCGRDVKNKLVTNKRAHKSEQNGHPHPHIQKVHAEL